MPDDTKRHPWSPTYLADTVLAAYSNLLRSDSSTRVELLTDFLTDLRHWAAANSLDIDKHLETSRHHYLAEAMEQRRHEYFDPAAFVEQVGHRAFSAKLHSRPFDFDGEIQKFMDQEQLTPTERKAVAKHVARLQQQERASRQAPRQHKPKQTIDIDFEL